jgi:hypothetical protein
MKGAVWATFANLCFGAGPDDVKGGIAQSEFRRRDLLTRGARFQDFVAFELPKANPSGWQSMAVASLPKPIGDLEDVPLTKREWRR